MLAYDLSIPRGEYAKAKTPYPFTAVDDGISALRAD